MMAFEKIKFRCHWHKDIECTKRHMCNGCEHQPLNEEKVNGKNPPVEYEGGYCPSCGEPPYDSRFCVFCGQQFKQYFTPEEVRQMTPREVDENYQAILDSYIKWGQKS